MFSIGIRTLKTAVAALMAFLVAEALGLQFAAAAAIVAILSVFDTRKATVKGALQRLISAVLALAIGTITFELLDYSPLSFGVYLLFFVPLSFLFGVSIGLGPSSVLVTHLLGVGEVTWGLLANEMALMFLGTGFAVLTNIYAPSAKKNIDSLLEKIDQEIMEMLNLFARSITEDMEIHIYREKFKNLKADIQEAERLAVLEKDNMFDTLETKTLYRISLLKEENRILESMFRDVDSFPPEFKKGGKLADLLTVSSSQLTKQGAILEIDKRLKVIEEHIIGLPLPQTEEEFFNRSILFQIFRNYQEYIDLRSSFNESMDLLF